MTNYIPIIATDFIDAKGIRVTIVHATKPGSGKAYAEARFENNKLLSCLVCLGADRKKFQRDATQLVENSIPETFRQHTKNMKTHKQLTLDDVTFEIFARPEDVPIKGNASAIDDETDKRTETAIRKQLESGNEWAWCTIEVRGTYKCLTASDYLGCCSYTNKKIFEEESGYFDDMKQTVLAQLQEQLDELLEG